MFQRDACGSFIRPEREPVNILRAVRRQKTALHGKRGEPAERAVQYDAPSGPPEQTRYALTASPDPLRRGISRVSAEQFVAGIPGERNRDILPREPAHQIGRNLA